MTTEESRPLGSSFSDVRNEEELKVRYLVPWLERLGIHRNDLRFESSFSFRAGRQNLSEDIKTALSEKRPRLDILVTRSGRNLFVLEAKSPTHDLLEEDALQAISYARLVHPIAPYALVTNGRNSRLYSTITRKPVSPSEIDLDGNFEITLPDSDDFDALACFLRLSPTNLLRFARGQTTSGMRALCGSRTDLRRKYIPELHHPRAEVAAALTAFQASDRSTLAIVSDSGMGKTCSMCYRALELLDLGRPVLFFRGSELDQRFLDRIAEEFAWTFSDTIGPPALVKRLSGVVRDAPLLIFLDGIDEWSDSTAYKQLGSLSHHLSGTQLKLVISCKSHAWPRFTENLGTPTDFAGFVLGDDGHPGLTMGTFEDDAFRDVFRRYQQVYGFNGTWDKHLLEEARRNPFFMRVAFEVASSHRLRELRESSLDVFSRYYRTSLNKTPNPDLSDRILQVIASALLEANVDNIEIGQLSLSLGLGVTEDLPTELFQAGILERVPGRDMAAGSAIRFAFDGLRNYVIAFRACRWNELDSEGFRRKVLELTSPGLQEEALIAYYKLASDGHKRILDSVCYEAASRFLAAYRDIIQTHFAAFSAAFPPGNIDEAGLVLEANLRTNEPYSYGLRRLSTGEPEILILPTTSSGWAPDALLSVGAGGLANRMDPNWLHDVDPYHELLRVNLARLVPQVVGKGNLNENATPDLSRELLAAAVLSKPDLLNEPNRGPGDERLPMHASRIRYWLLFQQHWRRLEDELVEAKLRSGQVPVERHGDCISYSPPPPTAEERRQLRERCAALAEAGTGVGPPRFIPQDEIADRLKVAIDSLGEDALIEGTLFAATEDLHRRFLHYGATKDDLGEHVHDFLERFLCNYERLVSVNFPTLKEHFGLFRELPVLVRVAIGPRVGNSRRPSQTVVAEFLTSRSADVSNSTVDVVEYSTLVGNRRRQERIQVDGHWFKWLWTSSHSVGRYLGNSRHYPDLGLGAHYTSLRDYTYSWIEGELKEVGRALGRLYGIEDLDFRAW